MTIKITTPNGGSDSLDFGCAQTPVVATVTGTEVSSGEGKLELKTTTGGTSATKVTVLANGRVGIGTATADEAVQVNGAIKVTGGMATDTADSGAMGYQSSKYRFISWGGDNSTKGAYSFEGYSANGSVNGTHLGIASNGTVTLGTPLPVASGGTGVTGGSGWVKLATTGDITSGTSFTIDNCFSTTYHKYRFVYDVTNGGASSGNNVVAFRLRTGGASGADQTSTYHYRAIRDYSGHATIEVFSHDRNYVNDNYNRLDKPQHGVIDIFRSPLWNKPVYFDYESIGTHPSNDECFPTKIKGVNHTDATSITGLKVYLYSGETSNAWTGRMTVYGAIR